jgi:hypothetical protein
MSDMKRKIADEMTQSAIWLPRSLHERLKKAGGERGMGAEIRRRLEASFHAEKAPANPKTRELLDAIHSFAEEVTGYYGDPAADAFAFAVLKACVDVLLTRYQPKGEPVPNPNPDGAADLLYGPDHSIDVISRTLVAGWNRDQAKRAFADEEKRR